MKRFFTLLCTLLCFATLEATPKIVIGIAGGSGSGKTTLAEKIQQAFPTQSVLICQDSYYKELTHLPFEDREKVNFDHPDALDFTLLKEHIIALKKGETIEQPTYDFATHSRKKGMVNVEPANLVIVEGILLFAVPEIAELFDLKFFVDTDDDIRLLRRIHRDMTERARSFESVKEQYLATVKPMHALFVEPSKKNAHLILPFGKENEPALSVIITKLQDVLSNNAPLSNE